MIKLKKNGIKLEKIVYGIFGTGGFAREVIPFAHNNISLKNEKKTNKNNHFFFIEQKPKRKKVNGYPIISEQDFFKMKCAKKFFNIAIGNSKIREQIAKKCQKRGIKPFSIKSPDSVIYDFNKIGKGAIICANTVITSNIKIGNFFHLNIYAYVAHDCTIGNYVTFAPGVYCNGNIHIHDHAYVGTGAILKQGSSSKPLTIGKGAIIGMGSVVTKDVPAFTTVIGNPARPINKK